MKKLFWTMLFGGGLGLAYLYKKYRGVAELKVLWDDEGENN
jgi:hypothetical protein